MNRVLLLPLLIFVALVVFLLVGLHRDPREVPSPLVNKPAPAFQLPQLEDPKKSFSAQEIEILRGMSAFQPPFADRDHGDHDRGEHRDWSKENKQEDKKDKQQNEPPH